jgi:hypothetical protein
MEYVVSNEASTHSSGTKDIRYIIGILNLWKYSKYFAEWWGFKMMVEKIIV